MDATKDGTMKTYKCSTTKIMADGTKKTYSYNRRYESSRPYKKHDMPNDEKQKEIRIWYDRGVPISRLTKEFNVPSHILRKMLNVEKPVK